MLAFALLLTAGVVSPPRTVAAEDPSKAWFHAPCHAALMEEIRAVDRLKTVNLNDPEAVRKPAAKRALAAADAGLAWNNRMCGPVASQAPQQNAVRLHMFLANGAFLYSMKAEAHQLLGEAATAKKNFDLAQPLLQKCENAKDLPKEVLAYCHNQIGFNRVAQGASAEPNQACTAAINLTTSAGSTLEGAKDPAALEKTYKAITDGLAANQSCNKPEMKAVNRGYLLSYKVRADRALNVPFERDRDISDPRHPFAEANTLLTACKGYPDKTYYRDAAANCAKLLGYNNATPPPAGYIPAGETQTRYDDIAPATAAVRSDFVWDAPCATPPDASGHHQPCADASIHDGSGTSGWKNIDTGRPVPFDASAERVLFATIRNQDDLGRLFAVPPPLPGDFFKNSILLVAVQQKPHQHCDITIVPPGVTYVVTQGQKGPLPPSVRVYYALACDQPGAAPGNVAVKAIRIDKSINNGAVGDVKFIESGESIGQTPS